MVMGYDGDYQMSAIYKIKSGLRKAILAKGSSCNVTSGVMHKGGGGAGLTSAPNLACWAGIKYSKAQKNTKLT